MNTYLDCVPCFLRQSLEAVRRLTSDVRTHEQVVREIAQLAAAMDLSRPPPVIGQLIHRRLRELTGVRDPYEEDKRSSNRRVMAVLPELEARVQQAEDGLLAAARYSISANAIDMATVSTIDTLDVRSTLLDIPAHPAHGDWSAFLAAARQATSILYLADNAGEIAVDRLAVAALGAERVTVAVRGAPVINDATLEDAREVRMHELTTVIDNGSDAPGTILEDCSSAFRERFASADLIISKGLGNYETLSGAGDNIAFWFKVKCPAVARSLGLPIGTHALLPPERWKVV